MSEGISKYPRFVTKNWEPFDAVELARLTEKIVCREKDAARKYTAFYVAGVYGGIATGYGVGCCLRCVFCWVSPSRDFPETYGEFYTPERAYECIASSAKNSNIHKARISGCEPTLCKAHLISLLDYIEDDQNIKIFILETNGILFGIDKDYVKRIFNSFDKVYLRLSLKAGTPEDFQRKTGARKENFEIPFQAIRNIVDVAGIETLGKRWHVAAMSLDPRIMTVEERTALLKRLADIDIRLLLLLEEEVVDPYDMSLRRLKAAGLELEWPLKKVYKPAREALQELLRGK
ncbi:MAG: radical SAM protein [Candidatus Korarchaeota archaeon]|nr:radical SAM protein [Thermoproteota archaeon]MCR8501664.1 radical SAM protein [Thermoproteota archaeon]